MVVDLLQSIGLTQNESKIYNFLAENGSQSVSDIIRSLKISRSGGYLALGVLHNKSLVYFDKQLNKWSALEFDDFAENLFSDLKFLKNKFYDASCKSNKISITFDVNEHKNKLLFSQIIKDSVNFDTTLICLLNNYRELLFSKLFMKKVKFITDKPVSFVCMNNTTLDKKFFYPKAIIVITDKATYIFIDEFRFLVRIKDPNLVDYLKTFYVKN